MELQIWLYVNVTPDGGTSVGSGCWLVHPRTLTASLEDMSMGSESMHAVIGHGSLGDTNFLKG